MANITIRVPIEELPKILRRYKNQIPYATSRALNSTAYKAQQHIRKELGLDLTLRNRWTQRGIKYNKSTKNNLVAEVGTQDWYVESLVTGGDRRPRVGINYKGSSYLLVPSKGMKTGTGKLKRRVRDAMKELGEKKSKVFIGKYDGKLWLMKRRNLKKAKPVTFLGLLTQKTEYKKDTAKWENYTDKFVPETFHQEFVKAMEWAVKTAK